MMRLQSNNLIYHWYQCFLLIKEFGKRWSKRLEMDCAIFMIILAIISVLFLMIIAQHFERYNLNFDALKLHLNTLDIIVGLLHILKLYFLLFVVHFIVVNR